MYRKINFILSFWICLGVISCSSNNSKKISPQNVLQLKSGQVIENVICKDAKNYSYALYLPQKWDSTKAFPALFLFDAHARSIKICKLFKELADKYSFVLAASNESKNGIAFENADDMYQNIFNDLSSRLQLDHKRIYTSGFSGGAKVAGMLAQKHKEIVGVIALSSIVPSQLFEANSKLLMVSIAGNKDFNYADMLTEHELYSKKGIRNQIIVFNGKHEYPPKEQLEEAFIFIHAKAFEDKLIQIDNKSLDTYASDYNSIIQSKVKPDVFDLGSIYGRMINALGKILPLTSESKKLLEIQNSTTFKAAALALQQAIQKEVQMKDELAQNISSKDISWWNTELKQLNSISNNKENHQKALQADRLKAFISMLCYMQVQSSINHQNIQKATEMLSIYEKADPENADVFYFKAIINKQLKPTENIISLLQQSVKLGFSDAVQLMNEPLFNDIKQSQEFSNILDSAKKNFIN
ncbi:MAG: hypothetical protein WCH34_09070 [Bacteroidota bacterium]